MTEIHAIARARERYGLDLTIDDLGRIRDQICTGKAVLLASQRGRNCARYLVEIKNVALKVIFSHESGMVVTVEPRERRKWQHRERRREKTFVPKRKRPKEFRSR